METTDNTVSLLASHLEFRSLVCIIIELRIRVSTAQSVRFDGTTPEV